jgi:hypothetical protein
MFLSFVLKTDPGFRSLPLAGGNQSIAWLAKRDLNLYGKDRSILPTQDGEFRGKANVTMAKLIGQVKEMNSTLCAYLNKEKVYVSQAALGLVDARLIGVFFQAYPNLTFRDDQKEAIMYVMADCTPISISHK